MLCLFCSSDRKNLFWLISLCSQMYVFINSILHYLYNTVYNDNEYIWYDNRYIIDMLWLLFSVNIMYFRLIYIIKSLKLESVSVCNSVLVCVLQQESMRMSMMMKMSTTLSSETSTGMMMKLMKWVLFLSPF